jgi:hypothetical protein
MRPDTENLSAISEVDQKFINLRITFFIIFWPENVSNSVCFCGLFIDMSGVETKELPLQLGKPPL